MKLVMTIRYHHKGGLVDHYKRPLHSMYFTDSFLPNLAHLYKPYL